MGDKYTNIGGEYFTKNPLWHTEDSAWKAWQIAKMLRKHAMAPETIIELGCGAGEILHALAKQLPKHTQFRGHEISPDAFAMCRSTEQVTFRLGDIAEDEAPSDLLLIIDVFEHVEDFYGFLRNNKRRAKHKIFHIPLDLSVFSLLRNHPMKARKSVGHLHYFTKETALATLRDCGYNIIDYFYTPGGVQLSRTLKSKIAKFPRKALFAIDKNMAVNLLGGYSLMVLAE